MNIFFLAVEEKSTFHLTTLSFMSADYWMDKQNIAITHQEQHDVIKYVSDASTSITETYPHRASRATPRFEEQQDNVIDQILFFAMH